MTTTTQAAPDLQQSTFPFTLTEDQEQLRRELRDVLAQELGELRDVSLERVDAVARALESGRPGRHFVREGVEVIVRQSS